MKKWIIASTLVMVVIGVIGFNCVRASLREATAESEKGVETVGRGDILVSVVETGNIEPSQSVEVKSRVSGRLSRLYVKEGDRVERGQLIATIDPQEIRLQVEQTSASLRAAESSAGRTRISVGLTEEQVRNALVQAEQRLASARREWENQPTLSRAATNQARLAYESAVRNRDLLINVTHPQQAATVEAEFVRARSAYETDKRELERRLSLFEKGYVSQRDVDQARTQFAAAEAALTRATEEKNRLEQKHRAERENAENAVQEAKAALDQALARADLDKNKEQAYLEAKAAYEQAKADLRRVELEKKSLDQAKAQADQIRASLADTRRQLAETEIRAPMSGVVTRKLVEEGELVSALSSFSGGTPIVEIADLTGLQVKLEVNEIDVAKLSVGMAAEIVVDALPEDEFAGYVVNIAPASSEAATPGQQDAVVKYKLEVRIEQPDQRIKPGMSAKCTMKVVERKNVLRLPVEYVGRDDKGHYVLLYKGMKNGKLNPGERRDVRIGETSPSFTEIVSGVSEGDKVIKPEFTGPSRKGMMEFQTGDESEAQSQQSGNQ